MIKYILSPKGIILLAFAGAVVAVSVLMAWSELGFAGTLPDWLTDLTTRIGLHGMISGFFNSLTPTLAPPWRKPAGRGTRAGCGLWTGGGRDPHPWGRRVFASAVPESPYETYCPFITALKSNSPLL